jgi:hypothetical protein
MLESYLQEGAHLSCENDLHRPQIKHFDRKAGKCDPHVHENDN